MAISLPHSADRHRATRPPQFGLRAMLIGMAVLCATFALFNALGTPLSMMLLLFAGLAGLHVMGNAMGTWLRDGKREAPAADEKINVAPLPSEQPPITAAQRLQENTTIHRRWVIAALIGATVGGVCGGQAIAVAVGSEITLAGLCVGIGSSAVLGGFAGFMASSFYTIARQAWREAADASEPPADRHSH